jgi:hypothetical protein
MGLKRGGGRMYKMITIEKIENKIFQIRGKKVILDKDLAVLYGVPTRILNQAIKRNIKRFPMDFMFSLTRKEILRMSQTVISLKFYKSVHAFTEQGIAMLSSVLNSERAIMVNIQIMRAFVILKRTGLTYVGLRRKIEEMEKK